MYPQVKFVVPSYEQVAEKIYFLVKELGKNYTLLVFIKLPNSLVAKVRNKKFTEVKKELVQEIKKYHNIQNLEEMKKKLEDYWKKINDVYFENIRKLTDFDFKYSEYIVYFTNIIRGSYEGGTNKVYVDFITNYERTSFIVCEEIFHIHYWDIYKKIVENKRYPWSGNKDVWEISETIPDFIFLDKLFSSFDWFEGLNRNYPFIIDRKRKLQPLWEKRKNFKDFLIKVHENINSI